MTNSHRYRAAAYQKRAFLSAIFCLLTGLSLYAGSSMISTLCISVLAFFLGGALIWRKAVADVNGLHMTEDVFVSLSVLCAFLYGMVYMVFPVKEFGGINNLFLEAVFLIFILNLSKVYVMGELERPKAFLEKIEDFIPKSARKIEDGVEKTVFAAQLKKGSLILVKAGARVPVDGVIKKGNTELDESIITGNTINAYKGTGDKVYGATHNKLSDILVETTATLNGSEFMQIIKALKESEQGKGKYVRPVLVYSRFTIPAVVFAVLALWFFILWAGGFNGVMYHLVMLLFFIFFATPSALLVTRALSGFFAKSGAKKRGILAMSVNDMYVFSKAQVCFIDKTGTITKGDLKVNHIFPSTPGGEEALLQAALTAQFTLNSPFATALRRSCGQRKVVPLKPITIDVVPGKGVTCKTEGGLIITGSAGFLAEHGIDISQAERAWEHDIIVCVAYAGKFLGFITFFDSLKPHAFDTMEALTKMGKKLYLLSGDNEKTVSWIAKESGIENYYAGVLPEDKAMYVRRAQAEGKIAAMAGDGFNDILALLRADVSIAFERKDSLHTNWVDILIKNSSVKSLLDIIGVYKDFRINIIENMVIAFVFNILLVIFVYNRVSPAPWYTCISFMILGMLVVALNAYRLRLIKK